MITTHGLAFELHGRHRRVPDASEERSPESNVEPEREPEFMAPTADVVAITGVWASPADLGDPIFDQRDEDVLTVGVAVGEAWASYSVNGHSRSHGIGLGSWSSSSGGGALDAALSCNLPHGDVTFWVEWRQLDVPRTEQRVPGSVFDDARREVLPYWKQP